MTFQSWNRLVSWNPKVGNVVIIKEDVQERPQWKLGKITNLNISGDGEIRSTRLQVGSWTKVGGPKILVTKPLQKLYFLELNEDNDQRQLTEESSAEAMLDIEDDVNEHSVQLDIDF